MKLLCTNPPTVLGLLNQDKVYDGVLAPIPHPQGFSLLAFVYDEQGRWSGYPAECFAPAEQLTNHSKDRPNENKSVLL